MSFTTSKKDLFDVVQKAYPIAPVKSSLQILANVRMTCGNSVMEVVATDLDHSIKVTTQVRGEGGFDMAVNARKCFDLVREFPEGEIRGDCDENVLALASERGFSCKIAGADVRDFPDFPEIPNGAAITIAAGSLKRMVARSSFAVSKDATRACLCGVLWEVDKSTTTMVATDGHRLGCCTIRGSFDVAEKVSAIVSQKTLLHLVRILGEDDKADVRVIMGEKYILFETEGMKLCSKLIEGPYPDYGKVVPKNNPKQAFVERASLMDAIRRVSVLSNQKTHLVKLSFSRDRLETMVLNRDIGGEAREQIPVTYDGDNHTIGLNGQYFSEILSIADTPQVRLEMNTQISACLIFPVLAKDQEKKSDDLFLIMPLRILDEL